MCTFTQTLELSQDTNVVVFLRLNKKKIPTKLKKRLNLCALEVRRVVRFEMLFCSLWL